MAFLLFSSLAVAWISWYAWRFILKPRMNPDEPKELPYLVPFFGHVLSMFTASHQLFMQGRKQFNAEPYIVTIMGESMYVISSPEDILSVYKAPKVLDYGPFVKDVLVKYGLKENTVHQMFDTLNDKSKSWVEASLHNFNAQLNPGNKFNILKDVLLGQVDEMLGWDKLCGPMVLEEHHGEKAVSLYKWCANVLNNAQTRAFFGNTIFECCPNILVLFQTFEQESWKFPLGLPPFATRTMDSARDTAVQGLVKYLNLPKEERSDASWVGQNLCERLDLLDVEPSQKALSLFSFFRLINSNTFKLAFWILTYVLFDDQLLQIDTLFRNCHLLSSTCEEVMRLTNWPIGSRTVTSETWISGKRILPGRKLMMPYRPMHFDLRVFGGDPTSFDPRRFTDNASLLKSTSYRPFSGAAHYCPGRYIARMEVQLFVATALTRFEISLGADSPAFPKMDDSLPSGGIQAPAKGQDLVVCVKLR